MLLNEKIIVGQPNKVIEIPIFRNCKFYIERLEKNYQDIVSIICDKEMENPVDTTSLKSPLYDSQTYEYKSNDGKGFGIMQWTYQPRKENLIRLAYEMGSGVGNINVQFATFKDEITKVDLVKGAWSSVLKENDLESYTRTFMLEVENPEDKSENKQKERVDAAWIIYNGMEG